mmetsp:Transcript_21064/g.32155  ORF Transcript_21064/g.32155 Transcript_21064/m.32155 type:complete len:714 (+) Transcript_21064:94-2235(+)|eukprot:CAMPEP_0177713648 /NCGR_PEP_ID=MMETSP0484_2-20121128/13051_1 /TAXON_ID=354590 /ORGANISM="Rhodomonas lens, Strain RHODO" /LENGTH=713 /DNA_ID=CAMNT_0019225551 /DNA_START=93 /DNA_END=2234 /DNA_ORIENTATION=-
MYSQSTPNTFSLVAAVVATVMVGTAVRHVVTRFVRQSSLKAAAKERDSYDGGSRIVQTNSVLLVLSQIEDSILQDLSKNFCGTVITAVSPLPNFSKKTVYLCGDLSKADNLKLLAADRVFAIKELSEGYSDGVAWPLVDLGRVPILVHGVGVYYRRLFNSDLDHFNLIRSEHAFQNLTESTKPGTAHRTGIYLTSVEQDGDDVHFRLLRCSTNLSGPTADFGAHDKKIVGSLNEEAACLFENNAPLNHVLAQIYRNTPAVGGQKQTKAKIKAHADKTKDMPRNGLMAFCTFYEGLDKLQPLPNDPYDLGVNRISGLTKLYFRLKEPVAERPGCKLVKQFSVTLYPNSAFLMPLSTNRLYTHEIRPPALEASLCPTRMGYVVRCSDAEAVHREGRTFLKVNGALKELEPATKEGVKELRNKYYEENVTDELIQYKETLFSMNNGDYCKPEPAGNPFHTLTLSEPTDGSIFEELAASVRFEDVGKGRKGTVLVQPEEGKGVPIIRTTTQYAAAAHRFEPVHARLAQQIQASAGLPAGVGFNNALIEVYTNEYVTMGFHSDQAQDMQDNTFIALFSCYKNPELTAPTPPRKLVVESKDGGGTVEIPLAHNTVVVWSLDANRRFRHKIVLDTTLHPPKNEWLGVTFRTSSTFVQVRGEREAVFEDGSPLTLANAAQRTEFFKLRGRENKELDFVWPKLAYTISESDMVLPVRNAGNG